MIDDRLAALGYRPGVVHALRASLYQFREFDWVAAQSEMDRALQLAPTDEIVLTSAGWCRRAWDVGKKRFGICAPDCARIRSTTALPLSLIHI